MRKTSAISFEHSLDHTSLSQLQKDILRERYLMIVNQFQHRCRFFSVLFHILRVLISIGSLIVPALLSIQYSDTSSSSSMQDPVSFAYSIYWSTWVISLLVTTSNGVLTVFKVDKKYYFLHTTLEQLQSEGWQYLQLSGRYSGFYTPGVDPTHDNQFIFFCHVVEKIKMHQVEEEYFKLTDMQSSNAPGEQKQEKKTNTLIPPTPLTSLVEQAKALPPELLKQLVSMVSVDGSSQMPMSAVVQSETTRDGRTQLPQTHEEVSKDIAADRV
jgi:hypothetical protein